MPKTPFDNLPPADPSAFKRAIKRNLAKALRSLDKFSDSVQAGPAPDWPPETTYELFMAQLRAFRLISKRREDAPAIQLMREIDHSWHKLQVVGRVERCVEHLRTYLDNNLLGSEIAKALFELRNNPSKNQLILLVFKKKLADPGDLGVMRNLLPKSFQHLDTLTSGEFVTRAPGARDDALQKLRMAVARSAQEYLFSEHQRFVERSAASRALRKFILNLKYRPYKKKLFGLLDAVIDKWKDRERKEGLRLRQKRFRQKRAQKALRVTLGKSD